MSWNLEEVEHAIGRHVEPKDQRNIQSKINQLKEKVGPLVGVSSYSTRPRTL